MRSMTAPILFAFATAGLLAACSATPTEAETETSAPSVVTASDISALAPNETLTIDFGKPGQSARFDLSKGNVDLARVRIINATGDSILASDLVKSAEASSGLVTSKDGFVLRSSVVTKAHASDLAPQVNRRPGEPKCSPMTQTDCCECGFWTHGTPLCAGFWCPCTGTGCGGDGPIVAF